MKKIKKILTIALATSFLLLNSCGDEVNELQTAAAPGGEIGAFARIIESSADKSTNMLDPTNSSWSAKIEFVDQEDGALVDSYKLFATFRDNTIDSDTAPNYSILEEVEVYSWDKESFESTDKYPTLTFNVMASNVISTLGLDISNASGGDTFVFRGEIQLSDGRTFSDSNSGQSINSELFYNDAFSFTSAFVCVPPSPITGDWKIDMWDDYGDGWNGGYISVKIDGTETKYFAIEANGSSVTSVTFNVPEGTSSLEWEYIAGSWEAENTFKIYAPSGNLVLEDGPTPNTGIMALNLCNE